MTSIKYVIFDFDGVIADTESVFAEFDCELINSVLLKMGISPSLTPFDIRGLAGYPGEEKLLTIGKIIDSDIKPFVEKFKEERTKKRRTLFKEHKIDLGKNLKELLDKLDGNAALATNKIAIKLAHDMKMMGIEDLFEIIVPCDPPIPRKPAPDIIIEAMKRLGAKPQQCAYIGDNPNDMLAANSAGVMAVGFVIEGLEDNKPRIDALNRKGAEIVIDDFADLFPYIV